MIAPDPWEEKYTVVNVDADGRGEIVRKEKAIAPISPAEDTPQPAEVEAEVESSTAETQEVASNVECLLEDGHPFTQPTLAEMQALLLACKVATEVKQLTGGEHRTIAKEAYRTLSFDDQLKIDGLMVAKRQFPVYKCLGTQDIKRSVLVRAATEDAISPDAPFAYVKLLTGKDQMTYTVASKELVEVVKIVQGDCSFKVGDRVNWSNCPAHCEQFAPFEITAINGDYAKLDLFEKPVLLSEIEKA